MVRTPCQRADQGEEQVTRADIEKLMQEAGLKTPARGDFIFIHWDQIAMLLAHEREACAKVCEEIDQRNYIHADNAARCAAAIRARNNND